MMQPGAFVISLDFEIMWGVCDKENVRSFYMDNLLGVRKVIPALLEVFEEFSVQATFATVGMLFAESKEELENFIPTHKPQYSKINLSPYGNEIKLIGNNETDDPLHFGKSLLGLINKSKGQEIGCHTFCHYYCLEDGQSTVDFEADIIAAIKIAKEQGIELKSLVFPRNQFNQPYLEILKKYSFTSYRGNESSWVYEARNRENESNVRRLIRLIDSYVNITGNNIYSWEEIKKTGPLFNIPSSRFLRPYNSKFSFAESIRAKRIINDMTKAAQKNCIYHLWWHPHNFGVNLSENIDFLKKILAHYQQLHQQYKFQSMTMKEISNVLSS